MDSGAAGELAGRSRAAYTGACSPIERCRCCWPWRGVRARGRRPRRRRRCAAFAAEGARTAKIAGAALHVALGDRSTVNAQAGRELAAAGEQVEREMAAKCMQWPTEVIDCLGPFGALKDGCEEALATAMGTAEPKLPADIPAGPAQAWSVTLAAKPQALAVADDGAVLAVIEGQLLAVRDGAIAWRGPEALQAWLVVTAGVVVVARGERVIGVDINDGGERWAVELPRVVVADEFASAPVAVVAAGAGDEVWIGDRDARWFRVRPDRCARGTSRRPAAGCLIAAGELVDEELDSEARLVVDAAGRRALHEYGVVRMFDADWRTTLTARGRDHLGAVTLASTGLVVVVDDEVVVLDPERCGGEPFAPSKWPQPGVLYARDGDECPECVKPPAGCRQWRVFVEGVDGARPAVGDDGTVAVNVDSTTLGLRDGAVVWRTVTGGSGGLLRVGDSLIGVSAGLEDDDPMALFELGAADGAHRWRSPLTVAVPGSLFSTDDVVLARGGGWLIAGFGATIAAVQWPAN
jgi:hypothetical protein